MKSRKRKGNRAAKKRAPVVEVLRPTEEREAHNQFERMGMACRVTPVIDTLLRQNQITQEEYDRLSYYRDQASRAEDDMAQQSTLAPARCMGGAGGPSAGKIPAILMATPAILEMQRLERDFGPLRDLARRVCVDDWTLTRWAIEVSGAKHRIVQGKIAGLEPRDRKGVARARQQLRYAAGTVVR